MSMFATMPIDNERKKYLLLNYSSGALIMNIQLFTVKIIRKLNFYSLTFTRSLTVALSVYCRVFLPLSLIAVKRNCRNFKAMKIF